MIASFASRISLDRFDRCRDFSCQHHWIAPVAYGVCRWIVGGLAAQTARSNAAEVGGGFRRVADVDGSICCRRLGHLSECTEAMKIACPLAVQ